MSNLLKNLLVTLGISIVLFVGYVAFRDAGIESSSLGSEEAELETQQLLATLNELKSLNVSGDFFADPLFLSLKDFRSGLGEESSGRTNPFAPVE
jgi:hypothetical protein